MQTIVASSLLNFEVVGKAQKKILLILHGWGRSLNEWMPTATAFSDRYKVYILDLPGFGSSPLPEGFTPDIYWYAELVRQFISKNKLKNITLLGHSFGGRIGIILGSQNILDKLILVDAAGVEERSWKTRIKVLIAKIAKLLPFSSGFVRRFYEQHGEMAGVFKKIIKQKLDNDAKKITAPTIIIWGENDKVLAVKWGKKLRNLINGSTLRIVWTAGHSPHQEKSDRFLRILNEYL